MAIPQILQQLGQQAALPPQVGQIKQMMQTLRMAQNPQAMLQQMAMQNPNVQQAMQILRTARDPQQAFYELARQKGVDPNAVLAALK